MYIKYINCCYMLKLAEDLLRNFLRTICRWYIKPVPLDNRLLSNYIQAPMNAYCIVYTVFFDMFDTLYDINVPRTIYLYDILYYFKIMKVLKRYIVRIFQTAIFFCTIEFWQPWGSYWKSLRKALNVKTLYL